jgi:hypothetical protein
MKKINEDWLSVIIGLVLVVLIWVNALPAIPWPVIGFLK